MRLVTLNEYVTLPRPRLEWLLERLIPKPGQVLLIGPAKEGKSRLALQLSLAIAQGREFLGQVSKRPATVLYLNLDGSEMAWREIVETFTDAGCDTSGRVLLVHPDEMEPVDIRNDSGQRWVRSALEGCNPDLVVVDIIRKLHLADENDNTEMAYVGRAISTTFRGFATLFLHHTRKNLPDGEPDPTTAGRGASFLAGEVDSIWLLHGGKLRIKSRFDEYHVQDAVMNENGLWTFPEESEQQTRVKVALAICEEFPDRSHNQLAKIARERLGVSRPTYYRLLSGRPCAHAAVSVSRPLESETRETEDALAIKPGPYGQWVRAR